MPISNEKVKPIKKRIFISLLVASVILIFMMAIAGILIYYNKFGNWYRYILLAIVIILGILFFIAGIGLAAVVMTLLNVKSFFGLHKFMNFSIHLLFPVALGLGKIFKIPKETIKRSYVEVNNKLIQNNRYNVSPEDILILAPHCLQKWDCPFKITADVSNCHHCGRCTIDKLLQIKEEKGVNLAVVTGGTLARKIVKDLKPRAIVAVACERDLTEGILDTSPLPVIGILNLRPEGPCKNTMVDAERVEKAVDFFLGEIEYLNV